MTNKLVPAVAPHINYKTMYEQVVDTVGLMIVKGEYGPGNALPTEPDLSLSLGVSRGALREAVKALVSKGLLDVRPRTGTRVRERRYWNMLDAEVLRWVLEFDSRRLLAELSELREAMEPAAAALAAANADEDIIGLMWRDFFAMETAAAAADKVAFVRADASFHWSLLLAGQNELFISLGQGISTAMQGSLESTSSTVAAMKASLPLHRAVVLAIAEHNVEKARSSMRAVVDVAVDGLHLGGHAH